MEPVEVVRGSRPGGNSATREYTTTSGAGVRPKKNVKFSKSLITEPNYGYTAAPPDKPYPVPPIKLSAFIILYDPVGRMYMVHGMNSSGVPGGKREKNDACDFDNAAREFVEETGNLPPFTTVAAPGSGAEPPVRQYEVSREYKYVEFGTAKHRCTFFYLHLTGEESAELRVGFSPDIHGNELYVRWGMFRDVKLRTHVRWGMNMVRAVHNPQPKRNRRKNLRPLPAVTSCPGPTSS
jgi:8-oxo-dGTP pyrophosphatase MutT (NUDIX family)